MTHVTALEREARTPDSDNIARFSLLHVHILINLQYRRCQYSTCLSSHRCPRHVHVFRCKLSRDAARLSEDRRYKAQIEHTE